MNGSFANSSNSDLVTRVFRFFRQLWCYFAQGRLTCLGNLHPRNIQCPSLKVWCCLLRPCLRFHPPLRLLRSKRKLPREKMFPMSHRTLSQSHPQRIHPRKSLLIIAFETIYWRTRCGRHSRISDCWHSVGSFQGSPWIGRNGSSASCIGGGHNPLIQWNRGFSFGCENR